MVDRMVPSPLIDADGELVRCSCQYAEVCAQAGGQRESSSYWALAPTSVAAKFPIQTADGPKDRPEKKAGGKLGDTREGARGHAT